MIEIPLYTGKQVQLTELDLDKDAAKIADWCQNPRVFQRVLNGKFHLPTVDEVKKSIEETMKKLEESETCYFFAVRPLNDADQLLGFVRIPYLFAMHQFGLLRMDFEDEASARNYGLETLNLMLHYLFMEANFYKIESEVAASEIILSGLFEQAGFTKEVVGREAIFDNGAYVDEYVYGITRPEYKLLHGEVTK